MVNHSHITKDSESDESELVEDPSWFVYICQSQAGNYYVGISPDPLQRLKKHNSGKGSKMANDQGRFKLLYVSRPFVGKSEARKREIQIKRWTRVKKEKLIAREWV